MIIAINYANEKYKKAQRLNTKMALENGVDKVIEYSEKDIDKEFYCRNENILSRTRGNGYWLWKPYIIKKTLDNMEEGDYLLYSDAGSCLIESIQYFTDNMIYENTDVMIFSQNINILEKYWSKMDAILLMECNKEEILNSSQTIASFIFLKKTFQANNFIEQWLKYSEDERIITDNPNTLGVPNCEDWKENRHDQTVLSLLTKKNKIKTFRDPSTLSGEYDKEILDRSKYPKMFELHRMGEVSSLEEVYCNYYENKHLIIDRNLFLDRLKNKSTLVIYGAGKRGIQLKQYLEKEGYYINAFVISDDQVMSNTYIDNIQILFWGEACKIYMDSVFLLSIGNGQVIERMKKNHFNFIMPDYSIYYKGVQ